ncbi:MAG: hypothetical protein JOZ38_06690 [Candidatus Eremiobacteraeota bacterium]|nr:hypothetical protein [Candidatus Eremiobacteraeota bacterium]
MNARLPVENADTVSLICALLVRFPEIASVRSMPADGTVQFTFVVRKRLDAKAKARVIGTVEDHVESFLHLRADASRELRVLCEADRAMTFVHVVRDLDSFSKDELLMLVSVLCQLFPEALVRNAAAEEHADDDLGAQEELVDYAIEQLRDPKQSKSLVGFREEKRVLVYFLKSQKKAKASARS